MASSWAEAAIKLLTCNLQKTKNSPWCSTFSSQKANRSHHFAVSRCGHWKFCWLRCPSSSVSCTSGRKERLLLKEGGGEVRPQNKSYLQFHKHVRDGWVFNARLVRIHCWTCNWLSAWFTMAAVMALAISFQKALWNKWGEKSIHWSNSIC